MKKIFEGYVVAFVFSTICCGIAAVMGLIESHDKNKRNKRRPFGPTAIFIYTAEWIRCIMKKTLHVFQKMFRRHDHHTVKFDDDTVHRLSPEMMDMINKAPHYTMEELEGSFTGAAKEPIIITD